MHEVVQIFGAEVESIFGVVTTCRRPETSVHRESTFVRPGRGFDAAPVEAARDRWYEVHKGVEQFFGVGPRVEASAKPWGRNPTKGQIQLVQNQSHGLCGRVR